MLLSVGAALHHPLRKFLSLRFCNAILLSTLLIQSVSSAHAQKREAQADNITGDQMRAYLTFVASDEMEGRDTPSRGLDITAKFIASHLTRWGFKPAGTDGTFFQKIFLERRSVKADESKLELNGTAFKYGEDYIASGQTAEATAPLVYAGYGWLVKAKEIDAYKGLDVKDKLVVVHYNPFGVAPGVRRSELKGKEGEDYADPVTYAKMRGAAGIVYILSGNSRPDRLRSMLEGQGVRIQRPQKNTEKPFPIVYVKDTVVKPLFQGESSDADAIYKSVEDEKPLPGFALNPDKKLKVSIVGQTSLQTTQNVVALWEGSDKVLKDEYVAVGAHYDHVGMSTRGTGDTIFNGADDDGSGTVALMAMAEALSKARKRPKRSVLFVWHCGEEKGMWGSSYFTDFPTVPIDKIITQLNIDMIGRSKPAGDTKAANAKLTAPDEVYVVGSKKMSTELGELSERLNNRYLKLRFNYLYDDPQDRERIFYRSDHYSYASKGIPIIFYFDGTHEDYHRVSDHVEKIDFAKMERITRTVYLTLWELTERKKRPVVDKKLE